MNSPASADPAGRLPCEPARHGMSRALPPPVCSLACLGAARRVLPVLADKCVPGIPRPGVEVKCQSLLPKAKQNYLSMSTLIGPDRLGACFFAARIANNRTGADCPAVPAALVQESTLVLGCAGPASRRATSTQRTRRRRSGARIVQQLSPCPIRPPALIFPAMLCAPLTTAARHLDGAVADC